MKNTLDILGGVAFVAQQAVELGLASTEELESISAGWRAWAEDPDAFFTFIHVEAVGRVD